MYIYGNNIFVYIYRKPDICIDIYGFHTGHRLFWNSMIYTVLLLLGHLIQTKKNTFYFSGKNFNIVVKVNAIFFLGSYIIWILFITLLPSFLSFRILQNYAQISQILKKLELLGHSS